jgi:PAS domain S-box-containing protein
MRIIIRLLAITATTSSIPIAFWNQTSFASLFKENFWLFGAALIILALIASPFFGFIWYRLRAREYRLQCEIAHEKNRVQEELKGSENRFRELFEDAPVGYHELDSEGRIVRINRTELAMLGYTQEEMAGEYIWKFINDGEVSRHAVLAKLSGKTPPPADGYERTFHRKDGTSFSVLVKDMLLKDSYDQITGIRSTIQDVNEQKQAEERIQKSEEKYRSIFENVQDVYYETSIDGTILEISPSVEIVSKGQYQRNELIGQSMNDFYSAIEERQAILSAIQERGSITDFEITLKNRDGSQIPCSISAKIEFDAQGHPEKIIGSMHDITERKRSEEALRESEVKYRTFFENSTDAILLATPDGRIKSANQAACTIFGCLEEELVELGRSGIMDTTDPRFSAFISERTLKGKARSELTLIRNDGTRFPAEVSSAIFENREGQANASVIIHDITERKQVVGKLQRSEDRYNALFERSLDPVYISDFEGNFIDANNAALKLLGYKKEEIGSLNFASMLSEDQLPLAFKVTQEIRETGIQKDLVEFRLKCKNGKELHCRDPIDRQRYHRAQADGRGFTKIGNKIS